MRFRTWPVAAIGLGSLLLLIVVSMLTLSRKAQEIYTAARSAEHPSSQHGRQAPKSSLGRESLGHLRP